MQQLQGPVIFKLGGSLVHHGNGEIIRRLGDILTAFSTITPLLIVPGGGPFADTVRKFGEQLELGAETCHFMALSAMDQYAFLLRDLIPESRLTDLEHMAPADTGLQILLCSRLIGHVPVNDLARSWDVTSDSIAAYLAQRLNSSMLVVIKSKDIDPVFREPDVDAFFQSLLPLPMPVWFINGFYPERVAELLQTGSTRGTFLPPNRFSGQFVP